MRTIYKIDRRVFGRRQSPVYYENIVDLAEDVAAHYYEVCVIGTVNLLESIKSLCLIHHPDYFRSMRFYLNEESNGSVHSTFTAIVSEVEVGQDGHLLSTSS